MAINKTNYRGDPRQDHPIPIETIQDVNTKFDVIRDNIEILWKRVRTLDVSLSDTAEVAAAAAKGGSAVTPSLTDHGGLSGLGDNDHPQYVEPQFFGYNIDGNETVDATGIALAVKTEVKKDSVFTHAADSAEVEVGDSGTYEIIAESGFNFSEEAEVELSIQRDQGSGYTNVEGTLAHASASGDESSTIIRLTSADSPHVMLSNYIVYFCNTDSGDIDLYLPILTQNKEYRIVNTGSSGNNVTIIPNGVDDLLGASSNYTLKDGAALIISGDGTDGWY